MPSFATIALALVVAYFGSFVYNFICNFYNATKSGLPFFCVPIDQNHFLWMLFSVPSRPILKKYLPTCIYNRLALTIYGFEFHEGHRLYTPSPANRPENSLSYVMVSPGLFEVSTRDPELALEIVRRPREFQQHALNNLFMGRFGRNLLVTDGDVWARQRKVVASAINERISRGVFEESWRQAQGCVGEVVGDGNADGGQDGGEVMGETTKLFDMMKKVTINVLSGVGMGDRVDWNDDAGAATKPKPGFRMSYMEAVKVVIESVAGPIILPQWLLDNYPSFLPGQKFLQSLSYAIDEFPGHTKDLLEQERKRSQLAGGESRGNIMSQLLQASEGGEKGVKGLSEEETIGNLFIFTAAGFDTTANTLSYALVLMCRYPQWQAWMLEEIDTIMPTDTTADLDYPSIFPQAIRTMAIMLETLRIYTPLVHLAKQTSSPITVTTPSGKTYNFPANATVYVNINGLHQTPSVWRNLNLKADEVASDTDEKSFRPTRWITAEGTLYKPPPGAYMPWSAGPRVCPGQKMAQVEFTAVFLSLFRRHRIEGVALRKRGGDGEGGKGEVELETQEEVEKRLEARMKDSISILTLQMQDVYNVGEEKGLRLRLTRRK